MSDRCRTWVAVAVGAAVLGAVTTGCTQNHPAAAAAPSTSAAASPAVSASAAATTPPAGSPPPPAPSSPLIRTTEADRLPGETTGAGVACTAAAVRLTVVRFMAAFNTGDRATLQQLWASPDQSFIWYLDGAQTARNRGALGAFFAARHAHHEVLRLISFQFNGIDDQGHANFYLTLTRSTDGQSATSGWGKGVVNCSTSPLD